MSILSDITERAKRYAGRSPDHAETIYGGWGIDREDFMEFCVEIETAYGVNLRPLFEQNGAFKDATVAELVAYISTH